MRRLKAVGWPHERCMRPMRASAAEWRKLTGVDVVWQERSGESFAAEPLEAIAREYDLISFDHPLVGAVAAERWLLPLDALLSPEVLAELAADAIGDSHASYQWAGHQWGLATDAACQVSAYRPDLLPVGDVPTTWQEAAQLAEDSPGQVTISLDGHDALCALLTLCANAGTPVAPNPDRFADPEIVLPWLEWLGRFASRCHPSAWEGHAVGPMTQDKHIVYCLLQWGFTNYSRPSFAGHRLQYVDIPSAGQGPVGSTLGGAGLGVSAWSADPVAAARYAAWVTGQDVQRSVVFPNGGQPGSRTVWDDRALDGESGGFFSGTRRTMDAACIRPRAAWWPQMSRHGGRKLIEGIGSGKSPQVVLSALEACYRAALAKTEQTRGSGRPGRDEPSTTQEAGD